MSSTVVRIGTKTKERLEELGGQDYTIDEVINLLLCDFMDYGPGEDCENIGDEN